MVGLAGEFCGDAGDCAGVVVDAKALIWFKARG
jgi:hypothetical protein